MVVFVFLKTKKGGKGKSCKAYILKKRDSKSPAVFLHRCDSFENPLNLLQMKKL